MQAVPASGIPAPGVLPTSLQGCWLLGAHHGPPWWGLGMATWPMAGLHLPCRDTVASRPPWHQLALLSPGEGVGEATASLVLPAFPPCHAAASSARGEGSPGVTESPLLSSCYQAGFAITFSSVSLTVRSQPPQELRFVEISSVNSEF